MKLLTTLLLFLAPSIFAMSNVNVACTVGGKPVVTSGISSITKVQASYPQCTITVYKTGTTTLVSIYSDNNGTAQANPFIASSTGYGHFYVNDGYIDVQISGGVPSLPSPFTFGAIAVFDPRSQWINPTDILYGVKADGVTDDSAAFQLAVNAACGTTGKLIVPKGTMLLNSTVTCTLNGTLGFTVMGGGTATRIRAGSSQGAFRLVGTAGGTYEKITLTNISWDSAAPTSTAFLLNLRGVAAFYIENMIMDGDNKTDVGMLLEGAQQGQIAGGLIHDTIVSAVSLNGYTGGFGLIGSNAVEIHGLSINTTAPSGILIQVASDGDIHGNHITSATRCIDFQNNRAYSAVHNITNNHFEACGTSVAVLSQRSLTIVGNSSFGPSTQDVYIDGAATNALIQANQFNTGVTITANVGQIAYLFNKQLGFMVVDPAVTNQIFSMGNTNDAGTGQQYPNRIIGTTTEFPGFVNLQAGNPTCSDSNGRCIWNFNRNGISAAPSNASRDQWQLSFNLANDAVRLQRYSGAGATKWQDLNIDSAGNWGIARAFSPGPVLFANLGSLPAGYFVWCTDCSTGTPCTGGGAGAFAFKRGNWTCPF